MDFSIVIPVRNRPDMIRQCVAACYRSTLSPTRYEVLVVDNGSTDGTAREAQRAGARVVSLAEPDRCAARNLGARVARGRWVVFTDSDCEPEPGWLAAYADALAEPPADGADNGADDVALLAGDILDGPARTSAEAYIAARRWIDQAKFLEEGRRFSPPFAATANLAVRRDAFLAVGGFDSSLKVAAEDADLCLRMRDAGAAIRRVPAARVVHHHRATLRDMLRQAHGYGVGNAEFFARHRERFGARCWIDLRWWVWSAKGFARALPSALLERDATRRPFALYDGLTCAAQAIGRLQGGLRHGVLVL